MEWSRRGLLTWYAKELVLLFGQRENDNFLLILASFDVSTAQQFLDSFFAECEVDEDSVLVQFVNDRIALARGFFPKQLLKHCKPEQLWKQLILFDFYKFVLNSNRRF